MYSDCRGRLQHKGSFGFVQNAEKIVQVARLFFFLTETSNAENKATVYLIFLPTCLQELTRGHHLIFIHGTLPQTKGLNMYETDTPTLPPPPPPPPPPFKGFPSSAICPGRVRHGEQFYQSMRVLFS